MDATEREELDRLMLAAKTSGWDQEGAVNLLEEAIRQKAGNLNDPEVVLRKADHDEALLRLKEANEAISRQKRKMGLGPLED